MIILDKNKKAARERESKKRGRKVKVALVLFSCLAGILAVFI